MSNASSKKQSARAARAKRKPSAKKPPLQPVRSTPVAEPAATSEQAQSAGAVTAPSQYAAANWGPWRGLLMIGLSFIGGQAITLGLISFVPPLLHISNTSASVFFNSTFGQFVTVASAYGLAVLFLWRLLRRRGAANWRAIGFTRTWQGRDIGYALISFVVYFAIFAAISTLFTWLFHLNENQQQETGFDSIFTRVDLLMAFVSLVLLPPLVEEILFRGVLFGGFRRRFSFVQAALWTSVFFAVPHLLEAKSGGLLWMAGLDTFVLSLVLCYLREKTGSLWASVFLHTTKNCIAFLSLFVFVR